MFITQTEERNRWMTMFFFCLVQKRCGKKSNTVELFIFVFFSPHQAKRCNAGPEEETLRQQELQRGDAGVNGEKMWSWRCWKLTCWAATRTRSSPSPSLYRFWKRAWKTVATGFMSTWLIGTSWMECWSKSSPPRITLQQSSRTKCSRSYRSDSKLKSAMITTVVNFIRYVVRLLCGRLGPTPSEAAPIWPVWSTFTRNLKGKVLSSRWRIWMRCHPFTLHRGWEENKHKDLTALNFTQQYPCLTGAFISQGTPEVDPAMIKYLATASPARTPSPSPASAAQARQMPSPITATPEQVNS